MSDTLGGTLELVNLENLWNEELACEFPHRRTPCSEVIVAEATSCFEHYHVCQAATNLLRTFMMRPDAHCVGCGRHVFVCWKVLPV